MNVNTHDLLCAYIDCRKRKRNTESAAQFEAGLNRNLRELKEDLNSGTYEIGPSRCFVVTRPRPREIWAGAFRDRVVHHLMYNAIADNFIKSFSADSSACIKGRGTLYGAARLEAKVRSVTQNWTKRYFYLKLDLSNFFVSIHKPTLFDLLTPKIESAWMRNLTEKILFNDPTDNYTFIGPRESLDRVPPHKSLFNAPEGCGLPSGNFPSQFFANVHLNPLDQFVGHQIRPHGYARYVDDFVLLHPDPAWLNEAKRKIEGFLADRLKMAINPKKTIIQPVDHGIDYVGYIIKPWRTVPRKTLAIGAKRAIRERRDNLPEQMSSYLGLMRQARSHNARAKLCRELLRAGYCVDHGFTKVHPPEGAR